jgi:hypothetical protein
LSKSLILVNKKIAKCYDFSAELHLWYAVPMKIRDHFTNVSQAMRGYSRSVLQRCVRARRCEVHAASSCLAAMQCQEAGRIMQIFLTKISTRLFKKYLHNF